VEALYLLQGDEGDERSAPSSVCRAFDLPDGYPWDLVAHHIIGRIGDDHLAAVLPELGIDDPLVSSMDD